MPYAQQKAKMLLRQVIELSPGGLSLLSGLVGLETTQTKKGKAMVAATI